MAVFRVERTRDYTVMCNHHLKDSNLSLKAKGLLSMMLSLPDEWNYTTRGLAAICKEGVDAIGKTLKELELAGYIIRRQLRGKDGRISDTEYTIFEKPRKPSPPDTTLPDTENPYLDNAILPSVLICVLPCGFSFWLSGSLELSTFLSIVIFSLGLVGPIIAAFTFTDDLAVLGTNVEEISQLLNAEELNHKETPIKLEDTGISLRSVSFSYDGTTEVLHDVNLTIHPGTMTALVGPSGSGKSTVAKLIAGYWDVTSGSITLGGHELKDIPLSEIADQISYVSQDNYLFNRSIRENIRMGRPGATDAEVEQAAKQSGCDAFIRKLDNGYDTVVGSAGSHLSGGERQRIAIARAMLKNAPVVILDEATAYIDPENEALVQKAISTLTVGKTLIVIAHRLSTIVGADNIVVVKDGTIHAQGTHEKLLETCPLYRDMWQAHIGAKDQM